MKRTIGLLVLFALAGAGCIYVPYERTAPPPGDDRAYNDDRYNDLDSSYFYNELQPYGLWVNYTPYGYVWIPGDVGYNWRPYTRGRWAWTDYGWTWVSLERWGWIAFHYGRWGWDGRLGWYWVPDIVWGPAWVAWRWGDAHIGWAPLPPGAAWQTGRGFPSSHRWDIPGRYWNFVRGRDFMDRTVDRWILPAERNITIIELTRFEVNVHERGGRVVDDGVDVNEIRRQTGRTVDRLTLKDATRPGPDRVEGGDLVVSKPVVRRNDAARPQQVVDRAKAERDLSGETGSRVYRQARKNEEEIVRQEHVQEQQLMRQSQETEIGAVRRKAEEEKAKVRSDDEKKQVEARTTSRLAELKKKHDQEKADLEKRQKAEQEKAKKAPVRRKTEPGKADKN
jgi:Family of unknown function (DUF6600)